MKKKLLLISYSFPPIAAPESFLSAKTFACLSDEYDITVICAEASPRVFPIDASLNSYVKDRFKKISKIPIPSWMKHLHSRGLASKVFLVFYQFPDRLSILTDRVAEKARSFGLENFDILVTWSQLHSSHLAGLVLKKQFPHLKWYAHFSDPWVDNPFNRFKWLVTPFNRVLEKRVIEGADCLLFTSQLTVDLVLKKYPPEVAKKAFVVSHPFDPSLYSTMSLRRRHPNRILFRYIGNFYGDRTPAPIYKALNVLKAEHPELLGQIRFEFVGTNKSVFNRGEQGFNTDIVENIPPVSYRRSLEMMQNADVLLVIDAPSEESVFLPSKLVDYIGTGKVILGITPPGTSADLIRRCGGEVADPNSVPAVVRAIVETVKKIKLPSANIPCSYNNIRKEYSIDTVTEEMRRILALPIDSI